MPTIEERENQAKKESARARLDRLTGKVPTPESRAVRSRLDRATGKTFSITPAGMGTIEIDRATRRRIPNENETPGSTGVSQQIESRDAAIDAANADTLRGMSYDEATIERIIAGEYQDGPVAEQPPTGPAGEAWLGLRQGFARSATGDMVGYAAYPQEHERLRSFSRPAQGIAGKAGQIAGGLAPYLVPGLLFPEVFGSAAGKAMDTLEETGSTPAAVGAGSIQALAELSLFKVAGGIFGRRVATNVGTAITQGDTRAAAQALVNAGGGLVAGATIADVELALEETNRALFTEQTAGESVQRFKGQIQERTLDGILSAAFIMTGTAVHHGIASAFRARMAKAGTTEEKDAVLTDAETFARGHHEAQQFVEAADPAKLATIRERFAGREDHQSVGMIALIDKKLADLKAGKAGIASRVRRFVSPGEPLEAMGARGNPRMEVDAEGGVRLRLRSASDIAGESKVPTKSRYASSNAEFEQRFQDARKGLGKLTLTTRLRGFWSTAIKFTQRGSLPELPRTETFGEARSAMQAYRASPSYAVAQTEELLARTIKPLSPEDYDLFTRKVVLDDLMETEGDLPFGLTKETAALEHQRVDDLVAGNVNVQASIEYRSEWMRRMREDYVEAHEAIGIDLAKRFERNSYFRHQVLHWARLRQLERSGVSAGPGGRGRGEAKMGRGFLKRREGSTLDISANYLQAEWEVASQMIADTERARALARLKAAYDIRPELVAEAKGKDDTTWEDLIPDGFSSYQLRAGQGIFRAPTVTEGVMSRLFEESGKEIGITAEDIREVAALGRPHTPIVVPIEVAKQLAEIDAPLDTGMAATLDKLVTVPMRHWKRWILQSPWRVISYNLRNATEVDKAATFNPTTLRKVPQAIKELTRLYTHSEETPGEVLEWVQRGGANSLVLVNELGEVDALKRFARLSAEAEGALKSPTAIAGKAWRLYWDKVGGMTNWRESILRYAAYLDYLEQIQKSPDGNPRNYGGSVRPEVNGIVDPRDKAFRLSSDLLGDYSDISIVGQFLRQRVIPFWSFQEVNLRAYLHGVRNIASNETTAVRAGVAVAKRLGPSAVMRSPLFLYKLGRLAIMFYGFTAALTVLNRLLFPEDDDELPVEAKRRAHITLGRDSDGRVRYFSRLGTAADFLEWLGTESIYYDVKDLMDGRRTLAEIAEDYAKSPLNKVSQGLSPFVKVPLELATKRSLFPDALKPRSIRDRGEHLARTLALQNEYKLIAGKPSRGYLDEILATPISKSDPGASAYWRIQDLKREFRTETLGQSAGYSEGARSDALYSYRQAIRFRDEAAATRYAALYYSLGGTKSGMSRSLAAMAPLAGLSKGNRRRFLDGLREEDRELLDRADAYYGDVLRGGHKN